MAIHKFEAGKVISVYDLGTDTFFNPSAMMAVTTDVSLWNRLVDLSLVSRYRKNETISNYHLIAKCSLSRRSGTEKQWAVDQYSSLALNRSHLCVLENGWISKNISSPSCALLTFLFHNYLKLRFKTNIYLLPIIIYFIYLLPIIIYLLLIYYLFIFNFFH